MLRVRCMTGSFLHPLALRRSEPSMCAAVVLRTHHLAAAFARYDVAAVTRHDGRPGQLVVRVPQREKLRFLAGLEALEASIDDVRIEEPSLEEVLLETS